MTNWAGAPTVPDELQLVVRGRPWLLTGDLSNVRVTDVKKREQPELTRGVVFLQ